jgi:hypothetical protein
MRAHHMGLELPAALLRSQPAPHGSFQGERDKNFGLGSLCCRCIRNNFDGRSVWVTPYGLPDDICCTFTEETIDEIVIIRREPYSWGQ